MTNESETQAADDGGETMVASNDKARTKPKRTIGGNLPYTTSVGVFGGILEKIIGAERPDKFSADFVDTVLGYRGGSARSAIPILKKVGFLGSDGTPTERYSQFKSDTNRSVASYEGLKTGFHEIFRKNEYAHKATEADVKDIIEQITGLPKGDTIIGYIYSTFNAIRQYIGEGAATESNPDSSGNSEDTLDAPPSDHAIKSRPIGLSYQINIVMPETTDVKVFDAIFKSLKENLL